MDTEWEGGQVICLSSQLIVKTKFLSPYNAVPNSSCLLSYIHPSCSFSSGNPTSYHWINEENLLMMPLGSLPPFCWDSFFSSLCHFLPTPRHTTLATPTLPSYCLCQRGRSFQVVFPLSVYYFYFSIFAPVILLAFFFLLFFTLISLFNLQFIFESRIWCQTSSRWVRCKEQAK